MATGASLWLATHPEVLGYPAVSLSPASEFIYRLASPAASMGLALLVLAWIERNRALLVFDLVYLVIVAFGWILTPDSRWFLQVITAAVLLLGSIGFALAERGAGRPAS
jgi:hypothetical protein